MCICRCLCLHLPVSGHLDLNLQLDAHMYIHVYVQVFTCAHIPHIKYVRTCVCACVYECTHPEQTYRHRQARAEHQLEKQDAAVAPLPLSLLRARSLSFPSWGSAVVQAGRHRLAAAHTCLVFSSARSARKAFPRHTEPAYDFFFGQTAVWSQLPPRTSIHTAQRALGHTSHV